MNQKEFNKFIKLHKVEKIIPAEFDGHVIYFDNKEWIIVGAGYDGVNYQHCWVGQEKPDTKQLFKKLQDILPNQIEDIKRKYGQ